jgi:hypothetical protein
LLQQVSGQDVNHALVTTLQTEREINTFFRLGQTRVQAQLRVDFPHLPADMDEETVFTQLRELRNRW